MTRFRLLAYDPKRARCRAKMRLSFPLNGTGEEVDVDAWMSRRQLLFDLEIHPQDPELQLALEHYKTGKAYKA